MDFVLCGAHIRDAMDASIFITSISTTKNVEEKCDSLRQTGVY